MADLQREKILKLREDTEAYLKLGPNNIAIGSSPKHRIISDKETGNFVVGKTVFTAHPERIKMGGVFQINGLNTSTMASTIVTPIPMFTFSFPMESVVDFLNETLIDITGIV